MFEKIRRITCGLNYVSCLSASNSVCVPLDHVVCTLKHAEEIKLILENGPGHSVVTSVQLGSCLQTELCILNKSGIVSINGSFVPSIDVNYPRVWAYLLDGDKKHTIFHDSNVCQKLKCPLQAHKDYSLAEDIQISDQVPLGNVTVQGVMMDKKNEVIVCFLVYATIIN